MALDEQQERRVEAIRKLLTVPDLASIRQGIELVTALGDPSVFESLLDGVGLPTGQSMDLSRLERFPILKRNEIFDGPAEHQGWLDLAMVHLIAASDLPLRSEVTAIALGAPPSPRRTSSPILWLEGLQRLDALTDLDLYLAPGSTPDLTPLSSFPNLTYLRIRGTTDVFTLPPLPKLEKLVGGQVKLESTATYPELREIQARLHAEPALHKRMAPKLRNLHIRKDLRIEGFEELGEVVLRGGAVELIGCRQIDTLEPSATNLHAPDLRQVGTLNGCCPGLDVSMLDVLDTVRISTGFAGGTFPPGATLSDPNVVVTGPAFVDIGNIGELEGLEMLTLTGVVEPQSLETLRHAKDLRMLDIRNSRGVTDLSPLIGLPELKVIVAHGSGVDTIPPELAHLVTTDSTTDPHAAVAPAPETP